MITQVELKELLHYDPISGVFTWIVSRQGVKASSVAGTLDSDGYRQIKIKGKQYRAHRLAWLYTHGVWPSNQIDHINRVRNDNRLDNLREATAMQNGTNMCTNTSGVAGVYWHRRDKKWQARIQVDGKKKHLGLFANIEDAAVVRRSAELQYHGVNAL